jgi:hypothetical protein
MLKLADSDWRRGVAQEMPLPVRNRYFESNPTNAQEQSAVIGRPGLKKLATLGQGPIRAMFSQPGSFDDDLFVVSGEELYRLKRNMSFSVIGTGVLGRSTTSAISMTATARLGTFPEMLFIAAGTELSIYSDNSNASATLSVTGTVLAGATVKIGSFHYSWVVAGTVNAGTQDGSAAFPWKISIGTGNADALQNLAQALDNSGIAGTAYGLATLPNPQATYRSYTATTLTVQAVAAGTVGNGVTVSVISVSPYLVWSAPTLTGGGGASFTQVAVPDDVGVQFVAFIAGFVIIVPAQGQGTNGLFYWIEPEESIIRPLNFATAERSADPILGLKVVGDQFWLMGPDSTESWYPTGDADTPFARTQGQSFNRGIWEGTDVSIRDAIIVVDPSGVVYNISGGGPQRISDNSIEERVRKSIEAQVKLTLAL